MVALLLLHGAQGLGCVRHQHVYAQLFAAAAVAHATDRAGVEVVPADGEAAQTPVGKGRVRDIATQPRLFVAQPDIDPGVTRRVVAVRVEVAADDAE